MTISENVLNLATPLQCRRGERAILEASEYVPAAGELIVATDTGEIRAGDGVNVWADLATFDSTSITNNLTTSTAGTALDAVQGNALNTRISAIEDITGIDGGVITE